MDDLSQSTFFDDRIKTLLQGILWGSFRLPKPINAFEQTMIEKKDELISLNEDLDRKLINIITSAKSYVSLKDSIVFLINAQKIGQLQEAKLALEIAVRDECRLDKNALKTLLTEAQDMPMSWGVNLYSEGKEARDKKNPNPMSSIDINRLRDFK